MEQKTVLYSKADKVATITLNRPHRKNAINQDMHSELFTAFTQANHDEDVHVIVLQGSGDSFCAGADIKNFPIEQTEAFDYGQHLRDNYNRLILEIATIKKPIVAYMNGIAVGAGLSIALACDYRVADPDAKMALSFLKIGLVPDAGASYFLPRLVGLAKAMELSLGEAISAEQAYQLGLINQIGTADDLVNRLTQVPLEAFALTKTNMKNSFEHSLAEVLEMEVHAQSKAGKTTEHTQAIKRFLTK